MPRFILFFSIAIVSLSCEEKIGCTLRGDNIEGRISFTSNTTMVKGANIVVEYSSDSFSSVDGSKVIWNAQGLVTVPYTFCVPTGTGVQLRAFQDDDKDGTWESGEPAGRNDQTANGNATFQTHNIAPSSSGEEWKVSKGVNIDFDSTTAQ